MNVFRGALFASMVILVACAIFIEPIYAFLGYTPLNLQNILFIIVFVQFAYPVYNTFVKLCENNIGKNE